MEKNKNTGNETCDCASFLPYLCDLVPMVEHLQARVG